MAKLPRIGILTLLAVLTATLLTPTPASAGPNSWQAGSDVAIYPLAVCRDGIRFLFAADWYPAGSDDPSGEEAPFRVQPVQAATPVPPIVDARAIAPADAVVLSFSRFDPASHSIEFIADVDNCKLFRHQKQH